MKCRGCGNDSAYRVHTTINLECCDKCGNLRNVGIPDVYFAKPYLDPHLIDVNDPKQKDGIWVESRQHKKQIMDRLGVKEAGDRNHGARVEYRPASGGWQV